MKNTPVALIQAINHLRTEEGVTRVTHGTNALIEAIRQEFHLSYEEVATAGNVSVAGLARWRKNDYGDHHRVSILVKWAQARIDSLEEPALSPAHAVRSHSLGEIEAHLSTAFRKLMGEGAVNGVKISELKPSENGELELIIRVV